MVFSSWRARQFWQVMLLFLADYEVDGSAEVFFGAGDVGSGAEGGDFLLDESFYLVGEDEVFFG